MNKTKFLQADKRWGGLGYPKDPCFIRGCGCGEVSLANILIEMKQYANYTPATIQPYCKRYAAPNCDGTYFSGIIPMMKHYGLTDVKECDTMPELWKELEKGNRAVIYLMGKRKGGSKKVHWTSGGHLVCSVDYKYENGKHYVYVKDSWTDDKNRNGWISYEENMKGDVVRVYVGKLNSKKASTGKKLSVDGIGGKATITATQRFFGTTEDGIISGQMKKLAKYYPSITAVEFNKKGSGSAVVMELQAWLGITPDGVIGKGTTAAWQKRLRDLGYLAKKESIDGLFGVKSMRAWQKFLNDKLYPETNTTPPTDDKDKKPTETKPSATPAPSAPTVAKAPYKVIDVSDHQGLIDWAKVKADGVVGAIIRYADGTTLDKRFERNMAKAKYYGLHFGVYIFSRAKTKAQARKEADRLFNAASKYEPDMPYYIDLEAKGLEKCANTVAQAFIERIKELGGKPGVYANLNWWNNYLKSTAKLSFAMWVAQYNDTLDYKPRTDVGMWQYSSKGEVNGISGRVDMDWLYVPYWESVPKKEESVEPPKPAKTIEELANEVLDGKWGSGLSRKENLTKAGYDYDAVQQRVNEILEARKDPLQPWYDAMTEQYKWSKNQKYNFISKPNVENSKDEGTCITFIAVSLQRLGLLPKNKFFYLYPKTMRIAGNGKNFVKAHPEIFDVSYPNKTIAELLKEGKLKKGDILGYGDPAYHTMAFMGLNEEGEPIFNTMGHKRGLSITYPSYANRKVNMLVRLKKVSM